jgi:hypothetical protein
MAASDRVGRGDTVRPQGTIMDRLTTSEHRLLDHLLRLYHPALKNSVRPRPLSDLAGGAGLAPGACWLALDGLAAAGVIELRLDDGGLMDIRLIQAQAGTRSTG